MNDESGGLQSRHAHRDGALLFLTHSLTLSRQREHEKKAAAPPPLIPLPAAAADPTQETYLYSDTGKVEKFEEEEEDGAAGLHCPGFSSRKEKRADKSTKINTYLLMPAQIGRDGTMGRDGANV